jgi:preprotein translocase subunit SecG
MVSTVSLFLKRKHETNTFLFKFSYALHFIFLALCLRVSILATIIGIALILPLNITARCFSFSEDDYVSPQCNSSDYNITNYEQTTLANIPSLDAGSGDGVSWLYGWFGSSVSIFGSKFSSYLGRLYAVVGFSWILVFYTLHLMKKEWVDALALRRVYYLEGFHWENRISELHQTVLNYESDSSDDGADMKPGAMEKRRMINRSRVSRSNKRKKKKKSKDVVKRDPWIPHPEQRETVPNIELYSVLVGNIPSLPSEVAAEGDLESMGFSRSECLDWQLAVTVSILFYFFHVRDV